MSWLNPLSWVSNAGVGAGSHPSSSSSVSSFVDPSNPVAVSETTAFNCSAIWAAITLKADAFGATPCNVYRERKSGTLDKANGHELEQVFQDIAQMHPAQRCITRTNDGAMTPIVYKTAGQAHVDLGGNHYAEIVKNARGQCQALHPLQPRQLEVGINSNGQPTYKVYGEPPVAEDSMVTSEFDRRSGNSEPFHFSDMLHVKGFSLDGITGKSPLRCARNSIGINSLQDTYTSQQLLRGRPLGFLVKQGRMGPKELKLTEKRWREMHEGATNIRRVAVLHGGLEWKNAGVTNEELQLLQLRKFQNYEIARWWRVPAHMLSELGEAKYANVEQLMLEFILWTMLPLVTRWEEEMNLKLFTYAESFNHKVFFDLDHWLRGDSVSRAEVNQIELRSAALTPDEWRRQRNRNPLPNGSGAQALTMGSQYDTLDRIVEGRSTLQQGGGKAPEPTPDKKKKDTSAKN